MKQSDESSASLRELLRIPSPAGLGPERRPDILAANTIRAKVKEGVAGRAHSDLILALILLWHDHLDESHTISQAISNADGSLLHGMMHRREPDYWNSKYWFRNAGKHPAHAALSVEAQHFLEKNPSPVSAMILKSGAWDPCGFVDACERSTNETKAVLQGLQQLEFLAVFDYLAGD